jgi:hypothetical protein
MFTHAHILNHSLRLCAVASAVASAVVAVMCLSACRQGKEVRTIHVGDSLESRHITPDLDAMRRLEGIWLDGETDEVLLQVRGDSIFYPDTTSLPARFIIYDDTLLIFGASDLRYPIRRQSDYAFDYVNVQGDEMHLRRSESPDDSLLFVHRRYAPIILDRLVKRDTVVFTPSGQRLHLYIDVNPTSRKVFRTAYNDNGMQVQQVYYDNIIHISVYDGRKKLFSRDIDKRQFAELIPSGFLDGAILSNMEWGKTDAKRTTFRATLCEPEGAKCYVVDLHVSLDGQLSTELAEY